ncbi:MAG TPA: LytTR family DNA-binding domain-containing protein, partial [Flavisolibacter sp.]
VRSIPDATCRVIFVTAYDAYAVQAFRLSAVDYLLKPVEGDDLVAAVSKIESDIISNRNTYHDQLKALKDMLQRTNSDHKIGIGMSDKILFVSVSDIVYCEASGSYTHIFLADGHKLVASKTLGDFETQLATFGFFRIHHSYLINLNKIREYQRHDGGYVVMQNGKSLEISQRKRKDFLEAITKSVI